MALAKLTVTSNLADGANYAGAIAWKPFDIIGLTDPQVRTYDFRGLSPWDYSNSYISKTDPGQWLAQMPLTSEVEDMAPCISSLMGRLDTSSPLRKWHLWSFPRRQKVDLHLGDWLNQLVPWYHGRLTDPSLNVIGLRSEAHLVVQGFPMQTLVTQVPMGIVKILSLFPRLG